MKDTEKIKETMHLCFRTPKQRDRFSSMDFLSFLKPQDRAQHKRLEAFMDALPFEYCGWNKHGMAHWSRGFPKLFGLNSIQTIRDIQQAILPSDAAALEGMVYRLQKENEPFTLVIKTQQDGKSVTLHGMRGFDLDRIDPYDVLWAEDTTARQNDRDDLDDTMRQIKDEARLYRTVLDMLADPIWIADDANRHITWCNTAYEKLAGQTLESVLHHPAAIKAKFLDPAVGSLDQLAEKALHTAEEVAASARVIQDGKRRLIAMRCVPTPDNRHLVGIASDITNQENLRAEMDRYVASNAKLLEQLTTAIAIFGANQNLEFYNQAFASLWGLEDQWLNTNPTLGDILEKLRETRRLPEQADFRYYKKSWLDMFTTLLKPQEDMLYLPDGHAIRYMAIPHPMGGLMLTFEDVTSRLALESSYNTLIAVQRETLDNLAQGVAVFGSDARLKLCNPTYCALWHLNPEDVMAEPHISQLVDKKKSLFKGRKFKWEDIRERLMAHAISRKDSRETFKTGDSRVIECQSASLPDGGVMVTYRDITDSMRVQQALQEKNDALEDAEKLKTDFLSKVSYQLRTPLNAISGFAEILDQQYFGEINDKQREYTRGITEAASRLSALINDILDLSTIEAGYLRLDKHPVDIDEMIDTIYDLSRDWAGMENVQIYLNKSRSPVGNLIIDERRLKQAILNIIRNAIHCSREGGKITLSLDQDDKVAIISVTDTGNGITEEEIDRLFEPFGALQNVAGDSSQTSSGLGLSLAKNIITMHKGTIKVDSIIGSGTTVTVVVPKM